MRGSACRDVFGGGDGNHEVVECRVTVGALADPEAEHVYGVKRRSRPHEFESVGGAAGTDRVKQVLVMELVLPEIGAAAPAGADITKVEGYRMAASAFTAQPLDMELADNGGSLVLSAFARHRISLLRFDPPYADRTISSESNIRVPDLARENRLVSGEEEGATRTSAAAFVCGSTEDAAFPRQSGSEGIRRKGRGRMGPVRRGRITILECFLRLPPLVRVKYRVIAAAPCIAIRIPDKQEGVLMDARTVNRAADNIRILSAAMVEKAKSGHPGGAMGGADFVNVLFSEFLRYNPDDMAWPFRDRFFLDPGHMSPMLYSVLALAGAFTTDDLEQFRQWGSPTPGHPEREIERGIENTSGPLGLGHGMALGAAIAERFLVARFGEWMAHKTYVFISDGGIQEEISQGVGRLAGHLGLANYIMFYDSNDIQLSHETSRVTSETTAQKYESWGWRVETIDGNDQEQIRAALRRATQETGKPTLIVGRTIMGKGAVTDSGESFERQSSTHGMPLTKAGASFEKTVENLGGDSADPFAIFADVAEYYAKVRQEKIAAVKKVEEERAAWEGANPELAARLESFLAGDIPDIDFSAIAHKENGATRSASGAVLGTLAEKIDNMIVCSADLSNSDNTNGYLKKTTEIQPGAFEGKFLQIGVSELTMGAIVNGMALHGGVIPACGTFFVFSDYMKPAVRLAALMGLPVKYIWTHDAFRVGEDGPTHQPVEQEAQIRLLEKMKAPHGQRSVLVLRPADSAETSVAWKLALENKTSPTALVLSRQNITDVPGRNGSRFEEALQAGKGAYVVRDDGDAPDLILLANGSEVSTLLEAADVLAGKNMKVRVVSAISEALFREQPKDYQESILPFGAPVLGLTAGLPVTLEGLAGPLGKVIGMGRFGASAPYKVLDEKFGYTADNVVAHVDTYMREYKAMLERIGALKA